MNVKYVPYENGFEPMPDAVVCFNRWAGSDVTDEEREYVPVIRCRECRHFYRSPIWCSFWSDDKVDEDDYCSKGEKR